MDRWIDRYRIHTSWTPSNLLCFCFNCIWSSELVVLNHRDPLWSPTTLHCSFFPLHLLQQSEVQHWLVLVVVPFDLLKALQLSTQAWHCLSWPFYLSTTFPAWIFNKYFKRALKGKPTFGVILVQLVGCLLPVLNLVLKWVDETLHQSTRGVTRTS